MGQTNRTKQANAQRHAKAKSDGARYLELRVKGHSVRGIARMLNVSPSAVSLRISEELKTPPPAVEELRAIEGEKLDASELRLRKALRVEKDETIDSEHLARIELALSRVRERRAKLFGLDIVVNTRHEIIDTGAMAAPAIPGTIRVVIVDDAVPNGEPLST